MSYLIFLKLLTAHINLHCLHLKVIFVTVRNENVIHIQMKTPISETFVVLAWKDSSNPGIYYLVSCGSWQALDKLANSNYSSSHRMIQLFPMMSPLANISSCWTRKISYLYTDILVTM